MSAIAEAINPAAEDPEKAAKARSSLRPLRRLLPYVLRYRWHVVGALVFLIAAAATTLALPTAVRRMIDFGFGANDVTLINQYFTFLIGLAFLLAAASALRYYFVITIGELIVADVRRDVFAHVMTLSPKFYDTAQSGEIVSRLTADTTQIKSTFGATASLALRNLILGLGALLMMILTSPWLSTLVIGVIPLIILPIVFFGRRVRERSRVAQDTLAEASAFSTEAIGAVRTYQEYTNEGLATRRYANAVTTAFDAARNSIAARSALTAFGIFMVFSSVVAVLWIGARSVLDGSMTGGTLSQFLLYAVMAAGSLATLSEVWGEVQQAAGAAERLSELLEETPDIASPAHPASKSAQPTETNTIKAVRFDGVSFAYPTRLEQPALVDFNLTIAPGETIALVGASGAGKSTIFSLLMRQYDPAAGSISIGDTDIRDLDLHALRGAMAIVPQDPVILSGTVYENIAFARPGADEADVIAAAKAAQAHGFVEDMPDGYATQVGERGITLSGGQRQRIAIARAVLRNAPILLLDEATSALDSQSEALVQKAINTVMQDKTTIVIAHRLATIRKADRIIVMDHGTIVETGTHESLSRKKGGVYARLAALQFNLSELDVA
ncbi:MAG: ABC transporter transmembrane domain-containing protein [Pseudomonadota bacterium]